MSLDKSARIILDKCMNLKNNESCLIVTDEKLRVIGQTLHKISSDIAKNSKLVLTNIPKAHGTEPPNEIAEEMQKHDVVLMPTTRSLSHTKARKTASRRGARIASMPGITEDMMKRALNVDFSKIKNINERLINNLRNKNKIKITTELGTSIELYVKGRGWVSDDGLYIKKGAFGNLPAGEIFAAPLEGKSSGMIADAMLGDGKKLERNIRIKIKNGFISEISGGPLADIFRKMLKTKFHKNVAELGIGTNYRAKITGNVLEDEKALGTCHIAFGNNRHFGGNVDVPFHVDFVIKKPTIYADGTLVMNSGKMIFSRNI